MRQLCNYAYSVMIEGMDEFERKTLDDELATPPGETPIPRSHGTGALLSLLGMPGG